MISKISNSVKCKESKKLSIYNIHRQGLRSFYSKDRVSERSNVVWTKLGNKITKIAPISAQLSLNVCKYSGQKICFAEWSLKRDKTPHHGIINSAH